MYKNIKYTLACLTIASLLTLSGCSYLGFMEKTTYNEDGTTTTERVWDAEYAKYNADKTADMVEKAAGATGLSGSVLSIVLNGVLAIVSGGLGIVAEWQRRDKNNLLSTLKTTVKAAGDILDNEKVEEFVDKVKEIQNENSTRSVVKNSLTTEENIAAKR